MSQVRFDGDMADVTVRDVGDSGPYPLRVDRSQDAKERRGRSLRVDMQSVRVYRVIHEQLGRASYGLQAGALRGSHEAKHALRSP